VGETLDVLLMPLMLLLISKLMLISKLVQPKPAA
jgi:hypothetical protein